MTIHFATLPKGFDLLPGITLRPTKTARKPVAPSKPRKGTKTPGKAPEPLERDIQRSIVQYLESLGACVIRINSGAVKTEGRFTRFNSLLGCPDLIACFPEVIWRESRFATESRFVGVEVKRTSGKVTPLQAKAHDKLAQAGALVIVARSVEDVREVLEREGLLPE